MRNIDFCPLFAVHLLLIMCLVLHWNIDKKKLRNHLEIRITKVLVKNSRFMEFKINQSGSNYHMNPKTKILITAPSTTF